MPKCKDCELWDIENIKGWVAKCLWESKEEYPSSIHWIERPVTNYMICTDGKDCPCFKNRKGKI